MFYEKKVYDCSNFRFGKFVVNIQSTPQYFGHFSSKIAINRSSTFQKFATFGKFFSKAEIAGMIVMSYIFFFYSKIQYRVFFLWKYNA
jgi:hypothetical protein